MSANNLIWIDKVGDKFRISMQFADQELYFRGDEQEFDSFVLAVEEAHNWEIREVVVEYGVNFDPNCFPVEMGVE